MDAEEEIPTDQDDTARVADGVVGTVVEESVTLGELAWAIDFVVEGDCACVSTAGVTVDVVAEAGTVHGLSP
jgi:hypothetical protein